MAQSKKTTVLGKTPDLQALLRAMKDARLNTKALAQQASGDVQLEDGTDTGHPSALVLQQQAQSYAEAAEKHTADAEKHAQSTGQFTDQDGITFEKGARGFAQEAKNVAGDLGVVGGVDGVVVSSGDLPAAADHTDDIYYVADQGDYYQSDGSSWSVVFSIGKSTVGLGSVKNVDQTNANNLTSGVPSVPSAVQGGRILAVDGAGNRVGGTGIVQPGDYADKEAAINDAINGGNQLATGASANGGGILVIPEALRPYDATQVNFDPTVLLTRANFLTDQCADIDAYGASADGSNDLSSLEAAGKAAASNGVPVHLGPHTYNLSSSWTSPDDYPGMIGEGMYESELKNNTVSDHIIENIKSRETYQDFALTHDAQPGEFNQGGAGMYGATGAPAIDQGPEASGPSRVTVQNVRFHDISAQAFVSFGGLAFSRFHNVELENIGRGGIASNQMWCVNVTDSTFINTGDDAVAFNGTSINSVCDGNTFRRAGELGDLGAAGVKVHGRGNVISNNTFQLCYAPIYLKQTPQTEPNNATFGAAQGNVIEGNTINRVSNFRTGEEQQGIKVDGGDHVIVRDNFINVIHENGRVEVFGLVCEHVDQISTSGNTFIGRGIRTRGPESVVSLRSVNDTFVGFLDSTVYWGNNGLINPFGFDDVTVKGARIMGSENWLLSMDDGQDVQAESLEFYPSRAKIAYLNSSITSGDALSSLDIIANVDGGWDSGLRVNLSDTARITLWDMANGTRETVTVNGDQSSGFGVGSIAINQHTFSNAFDAQNTAIVLERNTDQKGFLFHIEDTALDRLYFSGFYKRDGVSGVDDIVQQGNGDLTVSGTDTRIPDFAALMRRDRDEQVTGRFDIDAPLEQGARSWSNTTNISGAGAATENLVLIRTGLDASKIGDMKDGKDGRKNAHYQVVLNSANPNKSRNVIDIFPGIATDTSGNGLATYENCQHHGLLDVQVRAAVDDATDEIVFVLFGATTSYSRVRAHVTVNAGYQADPSDFDLEAEFIEDLTGFTVTATSTQVGPRAVVNSDTAVTDATAVPAEMFVGKINGAFHLDQKGGTGTALGCPTTGSGVLDTSQMESGQVGFEVDEGNNNLVVTVKKSGGSVVSGTVSLS